jgi:sec-independent protein translocase protein TatA
MGRVGELLVILAIVFLLFGTKRLKDFGGDLGAAIKGFKKNIAEEGPTPIDHRPGVSIDDNSVETLSSEILEKKS